jgi:glycosyltransferase involved in cell wall biosynthesis
MISVVIITRNEARDLPGCLDSVAWSDDVHVFDSHSDDATATIARSRGAVVTQRAFDNYAAQRNASLRLAFRHPWVLILDADERVPAALRDEMLGFVRSNPAAAASASPVAACRLRRRDFLGRTWLRHSQLSPYFIRLVRPERVHYEREVNEVLVVDGAIHALAQPFDHYPFSKGLAHWIAKHNTYSSMEARHIVQGRGQGDAHSVLQAFTNRDFNQRRVHQKALFYRLPFRPALRFALIYLLRRGFLDGRAGFVYAMLQAFYEYQIVLKTRELENGDIPGPRGENAASGAQAGN